MSDDVVVTAIRRSDGTFWAFPLEQRPDFFDSPMLLPETGGEWTATAKL